MKLTGARTPLDKLDLDERSRSELAKWYITSVEELVGALHSSPDQLAELLGLDASQLKKLQADAEDALDPGTRDALNEQVGKSYPVDGLDTASGLARRRPS